MTPGYPPPRGQSGPHQELAGHVLLVPIQKSTEPAEFSYQHMNRGWIRSKVDGPREPTKKNQK